MRFRPPNRFRYIGFMALALNLLLACHLTKEESANQVFTFPNLADALQGSDTAIITVRNPGGEPVDTLFHGPVAGAEFTRLPARNYKGGRAVVTIEATKDGKTIYKIEKTYTGTSGEVESINILTPRPGSGVRADSLKIYQASLSLPARGPKTMLSASIYPDSASQAIAWTSLDTAFAIVNGKGEVEGIQAGTARIVAASVQDAKITDTLLVTILPPITPERIEFGRAEYNLYLEGAWEEIQVRVLPLGANPAVRFSLSDNTVAAIQAGRLKPLKEGESKINAISVVDDSIRATARIIVHPKPEAPVESVTVSPDTLKLYLGGESLRLTAKIHPSSHLPRFSWHSASPGTATVDGEGVVTPVAQGRTYVRAVSSVDSLEGDSSLVIVKKDTPRIQIGSDTTLSVGQTISYLPKVTQEYGLTVLVRWDLDGDGTWEGTDSAFRPVTFRYSEAKEYISRFYAKDSEGNDTTVSRRVRAVTGSVILFHSPADGTYTNQNPIPISWSVDGSRMASMDTLVPGPNVITRTVKNAAGETSSATITVYYDTESPGRPSIQGPSGPISTLRPTWTWEGTGGGNGQFRYRLDNENLNSGSSTTTETTYTPGSNLPAGPHTLYVQERDVAGNWSTSGHFTVRIDTTPPPTPAVTVVPTSPTNSRRPIWNWTGTAAEGNQTFRFKLDNADFRTGATQTLNTTFTPPPGSELSEGPHTLYVQQADSAGNWSASGMARISIDLTPPLAPAITAPPSPTNDRTPTWTFTSRGGGNGTFRYKLNDRNFSTGATETSSQEFTPGSELSMGTYHLHVQEKDSAGNWSASDSAAVTIDLSGPNAPQVTGSRSASNVPNWTWIGSGRPGARFTVLLVKVGETGVWDSLVQTGMVYQPRSMVTLSPGKWRLRVREEDNLGNWGGYGEGDVDLTKPGKPVFDLGRTSPRHHSSSNLTWAWNAATNGGGGYELSINGGSAFSINATEYSQIGAEGQVYSVSVRAVDGAGIKGDTVLCHPVRIDLTPPGLAITTPQQSQLTAGNPIVSGTVSDPSSGSGIASLTFSAPGATPSSGTLAVNGGNWTLNTLAFPVGYTQVTFTATDRAGLKTVREYLVIKNLVFIKEGSNGNGSSWENAFGSFEAALEPTRLSGYPAGTQIWVSEGDYLRSENLGMNYLKSNLEIYGGFSEFNPESSIQARNLINNRTVLKSDGPALLTLRTSNGTGVNNVTLDGLNFQCEGCIYGLEMTGSNLKVSKCEFMQAVGEYLVSAHDAAVEFTDCVFTSSRNVLTVLSITGSDENSRKMAKLTRCELSFNVAENTLFINNADVEIRDCLLRNNTPWGQPQNYTFGIGAISIASSTLEGWNANPSTISVWQGSNLTIDGVTVPPTP